MNKAACGRIKRVEAEARKRKKMLAAFPHLFAACKAALPWVAIATAEGDPYRHPKSIENAKKDLALLQAAIAKGEKHGIQ